MKNTNEEWQVLVKDKDRLWVLNRTSSVKDFKHPTLPPLKQTKSHPSPEELPSPDSCGRPRKSFHVCRLWVQSSWIQIPERTSAAKYCYFKLDSDQRSPRLKTFVSPSLLQLASSGIGRGVSLVRTWESPRLCGGLNWGGRPVAHRRGLCRATCNHSCGFPLSRPESKCKVL